MAFCAMSAVYTLWLLQSLYQEVKRKNVRVTSNGTLLWSAPLKFTSIHHMPMPYR